MKTKMNLYYKFLWLLILAIFLNACEKDFNYNNTYQSSTAIVNCRFSAGQILKVSFTKDMHIDSSLIHAISDADIFLYEDGIYKERLNYVPHPTLVDFGYYQSTLIAQQGHAYSIKMDHPIYGHIEATDTIPALYEVNSLTYSSILNPDSTLLQKANFIVQDNPIEANNYTFYIIDSFAQKVISGADTIESRNSSFTSITKLQGAKYLRYLNNPYITDETFNGIDKNITLSFYPSNKTNIELYHRYGFYLLIRNVSNNYVNFEKSLSQYYAYDLGAYEEVPEIYSNVKGARGIFCAFNQRVFFYRVK